MRENVQGIKGLLLSRLVMLSPNQTSRHSEMLLKAMVTEPLNRRASQKAPVPVLPPQAGLVEPI